MQNLIVQQHRVGAGDPESFYLQAHSLILFRENWVLLLRVLNSYILSNEDQVDVFTLKNRIAEWVLNQ